MAFDISLYINNSEKIQVTKNLHFIATMSGQLKNETSIVDPVILVTTKIGTLATCNYMSIPIFGRSYFITDIVSIRDNLIELHAHCDVLSSFWDYIKTNQAIEYRQENTYNLYLDDGSFKVYQNPNIVYKNFPSGFTSENFVLVMAGPYVEP